MIAMIKFGGMRNRSLMLSPNDLIKIDSALYKRSMMTVFTPKNTQLVLFLNNLRTRCHNASKVIASQTENAPQLITNASSL